MKLKKEQLNQVRQLQRSVEELKIQFFDLEVEANAINSRKTQCRVNVGKAIGELNEYLSILKDEYGDVSINLSDGSLTEDKK